MNLKKPLLLAAVLTALLAFVALDLGRWLNLSVLQQSQASLAELQAQHPWRVLLGYCLVYVAVTALSLPGATLLTLAGGALFGLGWGTLLVSFASSLGATLAFLVARFLLRDTVAARFGPRLAEIDRGIARDGAFYLFTLRLIPAVPFFVLNLLMGLTAMRTWTYHWVSQLGMLPATLVYVNAGTQLAQLDSLRGILSPALLGSFALLGLFPLLARQVLAVWRQRRFYAPWAGQRPRQFDRNLVVIGAGAGGLVTAYIAAAAQAKVTLVEAGAMGGDCLNLGCVPSKALIRSATLAHQMRHASRYGLADTAPAIDWRTVMQRVQQVIADIAPHDSVERYTGLGVDVAQGRATVLNPWTVEIALADGGTQRLSTRHIVLATGARPTVPDVPGLHECGFVTSDTLWADLAQREAPPRRLLVLGGGAIGCELAQALQRLGSQVTLVQRAPRLLPREDEDVSAAVRDALQADGVVVLTGAQALRCERVGDDRQLRVAQAGHEQALGFDLLLCAVGRQPRLKGMGLEALGIDTDQPLATNTYLQTLCPNVYAAGDVTGLHTHTHAAAHQAWHAAVNALFGGFKRFRVDHAAVPHATFVDPEVARVGLSEQEARAQGVPCEVTRFALADLDRAIADSDTRGFIKVLTVPGRDQLLGATIVGPHAADLLAEFVLAMRHGLGLNQVLSTVHTYPTLAEANKYVAGQWKRAHAPARLLQWVRRYHRWQRG